MNKFRDILSLIIALAAGLGALWKIIEAIGRFYRIFKALEMMQQDNRIILKTQFVILDGLIQLQCNNRVTDMYNEMRQHLIDRGETI